MSNDQITGGRSFVNGKYRWDVVAKQPFIATDIPWIYPSRDFLLTVEAQLISGTRLAPYGVVFRWRSRHDYYLFTIHDGYRTFSVYCRHDDEWTPLIRWKRVLAIRPGEVNRLTVEAEGSHFTFFINDSLVAEVDDDQLRVGRAGLVIWLPKSGDAAIFEFDNFDLQRR